MLLGNASCLYPSNLMYVSFMIMVALYKDYFPLVNPLFMFYVSHVGSS